VNSTLHKPRLLLLTGTPPGTGNVGEIILRDLALHYGPRSMSCVAVVPSAYDWKSDVQLAELPVELIRSRYTHAKRGTQGRLGTAESIFDYLIGFRRERSRLVEAIVSRAREQGVQRIFAVLNNPLIMAVAARVASALDVPLVTLVWDPPEYLLLQSRFDRYSRSLLLGDFRKCLGASTQVAVVSENLQAEYGQWTRAAVHILRHGLSMGDEAVGDLGQEEWRIGFAGSMYSDCAWRAFLKALDHAGWRLAGRPVRLKVMTSRIEVRSGGPSSIDILGFRSPEAVQTVLANCHLNYMPQPFVSRLADLCRLSFPTKLTNYLAVGRPVFVHCPQTGALAKFFEFNRIGVLSTSLEPGAIVADLEKFLGDAEAYDTARAQVRVTARRHFEASVFHAAIDQVLGWSAGPEPLPASTTGQAHIAR
jgi:hypothetical protein